MAEYWFTMCFVAAWTTHLLNVHGEAHLLKVLELIHKLNKYHSTCTPKEFQIGSRSNNPILRQTVFVTRTVIKASVCGQAPGALNGNSDCFPATSQPSHIHANAVPVITIVKFCHTLA